MITGMLMLRVCRGNQPDFSRSHTPTHTPDTSGMMKCDQCETHIQTTHLNKDEAHSSTNAGKSVLSFLALRRTAAAHRKMYTSKLMA